MAHTAGPWKIYPDHYLDHTDTLIITDSPAPQTVIAEVKKHFSLPIVEDEANARLIAAAPDLLTVCAGIINLIADDDYITMSGEEFANRMSDLYKSAKLAFAKANDTQP